MTDVLAVDASSAATKDGGSGRVINGPDRFEVDDDPMLTTVTAGGAVRPRRRCQPRRCSRTTAAVVALALLSLVLAALLVVAAVRQGRRRGPSCGDPVDGSAAAESFPRGRELSKLADDGSPLPWTDIRLPASVVPESYSLRLRVDPSRARFRGAVTIDVTVRDETNTIVLHASSIDVELDNVRVAHKAVIFQL